MFVPDGDEIVCQQDLWNGCRKLAVRDGKSGETSVVFFFPVDSSRANDLEKHCQYFCLLKNIAHPHILSVREVKKISNPPVSGVALRVDDRGGTPLDAHIRENAPIPVALFCDIAMQLVSAVSELHRHGIVHQGLTTNSIAIDPAAKHTWIREFSDGRIRYPALKEFEGTGGSAHPSGSDGNFMPPALMYISPEQTGRMNRMVDYRTDFYSLGIIFHEILTGAPPFSGSSVMELLHAHMARDPISADALRTDVCHTVSLIILKLLSKSPDDRYQSAFGLNADLDACRQQLLSAGRIIPFTPGRLDVPEELHLPERIYGRELETAMLVDAYERVRATGRMEITMIAGYAGIGKTRLVQELRRYIVEKGGYFISGKYDQLQQDIPFSGLIQAFSAMIGQILSESPDRIDAWRKKLSAALDPNAGIIIDVIPELERIMGKAEPAADLTPADAQHRFQLTFEKFLRVFTRETQPLTLFIDDMQWADTASLNLMEAFHGTDAKTLPAARGGREFFFIGTYRHNEVNEDHALMQSLSRIRRKTIPIHTITLKPIRVEDVNRLLADTLRASSENVDLLARIIFDKTGGNPFFIRQFIQSLHQEGLLSYTHETGRWEWDIETIAEQRITDNVVDFMAEKVLNLTDHSQYVLRLASCIGNRFSLRLLAGVAEKPPGDILGDLRESLGLGIIVAEGALSSGPRSATPFATAHPVPAHAAWSPPSSSRNDDIQFEFLHDKVRQAVLALVSEEEKIRVHRRIGRLIMEDTSPERLSGRIFNIVNHLNKSAVLLDAPAEKHRLVELNLMAGKKAKEAAAFSQAAEYLKAGEALLSDAAWQDHYALMFALKKNRMECEYLSLNYEEAEILFEILLDRAASDLDRAVVYNQKMIMLAGLAEHEEALAIGLTGLGLLGVSLPGSAALVDVLTRLAALKIRLFRSDPEDLLDRPVIKDPRRLLILDMLMNVSLSAYFCQPYLATSLALKIFDLTLKHGNSRVSPFAYVIYGSALCAVFKNYETGYRYGRLALRANEKFGGPDLTAKLMLYIGSAIDIWTDNVQTVIGHIRKGIKSALDYGDLNYAVYHIQSLLIFLIISGEALDQLSDECERYFEFVKQSKDVGALNYLISIRQFVKCLKGQTPDPLRMDDDGFSEAEHLANMEAGDIKIILFRHHLIKLRLLYIMGDYAGALAAAGRCKALAFYHMGTMVVPEYYYYHALTLAALHDDAPVFRQIRIRRKINGFLSEFRKLAARCPENFSDRYLLLSAEAARLSGRDQQAMSFYQKAIDAARAHRFLQNQAIANEAAAKFYLSRGFDELAGRFLEEARDGFQNWGATKKAAGMVKTYHDHLQESAASRSGNIGMPVDVDAIVSSLRMISTEIVVDELLKNLMKIVLENAGARKVLFLSIAGSRIYLEAEYNIDAREAQVFHSLPAERRIDLFHPVLNYVKRTRTHLALDDASRTGEFTTHDYVAAHHPRSVLCLPVIRHAEPAALLYLENNLAPSVFTPERVELLKLLASQAAISLENARLYENVLLKQKELGEISARREEESLKYQAQLRSLSSELSLTEERERRRIAQELHDRIGHALAHASLKLRQVKHDSSGESYDPALDDVYRLIDQTIADTRTLTFELSPPILYDLGLEPALDWLAEQTYTQHGISVDFTDDMRPKPIAESLRILLFQAARELMFNIVKHARATRAGIAISREKDWVCIVIEDNGIGFAATETDRRIEKGGFGLFSIRERLMHQGGHLEIVSSPAAGSRVTLMSPMASVADG
jgi:predicted ATPase/signal transduction histidine kinase